jgi:hypothetical protein
LFLIGLFIGHGNGSRTAPPQTLLGGKEGTNEKIGLRWDHRVIGLLYNSLDGLRSN